MCNQLREHIMELVQFVGECLKSGNAWAIICAAIVYLIIYLQRQKTSVQRNSESNDINEKLAQLETKRQLMEKDVHELQRRADSTDKHFNNIETELKSINETLTELCVLMRTSKKSGRKPKVD